MFCCASFLTAWRQRYPTPILPKIIKFGSLYASKKEDDFGVATFSGNGVPEVRCFPSLLMYR